MRIASFLALVFLAQVGCSSDPAPSSSSTSGAPSNENRIGGIVIPASLPLCTSATGGIFIASGGRAIGWSWSAAKNGGTHYAIKITKAPSGATTTTTLVDKLVPVSDKPEALAGESVSGTYYAITGAIVKDGTPLCTMDGMNGITAS